MINKINRPCTLISIDNYYYIGIKENITSFCYYLWQDNPITIFKSSGNSKEMQLLNSKNDRILKIIASNNPTLEILGISKEFIQEYEKNNHLLDDKTFTVKYTYDMEYITHSHRARINYRPKYNNGNVILTLFCSKTKTY